jgi:hypothetical protein
MQSHTAPARVRHLNVLAGIACLFGLIALASAQGSVVTIDVGTAYQTIAGWEAVAQAGQGSPYWANVGDNLLTMAVDDVGIRRLRLEVVSGAENTSGSGAGESIVNDNGDPFTINPAGFRWASIDNAIAKVIVPIRSIMAPRGTRPYVNLCYVSFHPGSNVHSSDPEEYAEFIEATILHINSAFGFVPDSVEILLEPDNSTSGFNASGTLMGRAIKATRDRLAGRGWFPEFIAPSFANVASGVAQAYLADLLSVSGVSNYLGEVSYHRYGGPPASFVSFAQALGFRTSMLEYGPATIDDLFNDLRNRNASAWSQMGISYNFPTQAALDNQENTFAGNHLYILDQSPGQIQMSARAALFRQVFRYVRAGAVRLSATSDTSTIRPVAFRNPSGVIVVAQRAIASASWVVNGLPGGTYGLTYSVTPAGATCVGSCPQTTLADVTIAGGQSITAGIPAAGVLTIFLKTTPGGFGGSRLPGS